MILKKINKICAYLAGMFVLIAAIVMLYDVVVRYTLNSPSLYAPFIAAFLVLGSIFIGVSYSFQTGGQVYIEIFVDKLPSLPRKICFTIGYCMSLFFVGALTKACWQYMIQAAENNWKAQGNLPIPSAILYGVMVIGTSLLMLSVALKMFEIWKKEETRKDSV
jgi:TRAP-type C4-dicarboxylate transport system permease small subunit